jgi:hypothetical protein
MVSNAEADGAVLPLLYDSGITLFGKFYEESQDRWNSAVY